MRLSFCSNERFCGAVNTVSSCIPSIGCSNPTEGHFSLSLLLYSFAKLIHTYFKLSNIMHTINYSLEFSLFQFRYSKFHAFTAIFKVKLNLKIPVTLLELDPKSVVLLVLSEKKLVKQTPLKVKK